MRKVRVPFVEQMEENECGLACLAMILGYHGHHVTLPELRDRFGVARGGMSFYHLQQIAPQFALKPRGYRVAPSHLGQLQRPSILHWEGKHFVVLEKIGPRGAVIVDPAYGRMKVSRQELAEKFTGYAMTFEPQEDFQPRRRASHWRFFASLALEHPGWLVGIVAVSFVLQGLGLAVPALTRWITDRVIVPRHIGPLGLAVYGVGALFFAYWLFSFARGVAVARLQHLMDLSMMGRFMERLFRLPYGFFEKRKGGDLLFRANANVFIRQILSTRAVSLLIDGVLLVVYAVLMLLQSWVMGLLVIAAGALLFVCLAMGTRVTRRLTAREVTAQVHTQSYLSESIQSVADIKVLGAEKDVVKRWRELFQGQLRATWRRQVWMALFDAASGSLQYILPLGLLVFGAHRVAAGELSLGALLGFSSLATLFIVPIVSLSGTYNELLFLGSYIQRIHDVVASRPEQEPDGEAGKEPDGCKKGDGRRAGAAFGDPGGLRYRGLLTGRVELEDVSFRYDAFSPNTVEGISFTVAPGEKIGIVGASGAGKSTLAKLLLGLYRPTAGRILYDGVPLEEWDLVWLRSQIGAVLQESRLFQRTIADNIRMNQDDLSPEDVVWAAEQAAVHQEIRQLPLGYLTQVSETGANFSGGQRQRLLLARALARRPAILILDEATSFLDTLAERAVDEHLSRLRCTRIVIAHRLSTVENADRILVMDRGRIVEVGTHETLIEQRGLYYRLYAVQVRGTGGTGENSLLDTAIERGAKG